MSKWSLGRVTLVGDACDCPSLLSGQGSTLAMVGAYILAGELNEANGEYQVAYQQYEKKFKPLIDSKQKIAQKFAASFVPKTSFGIWARNSFANLMFLPFVSNWFIKEFLTDDIVLKDYSRADRVQVIQEMIL
jgi:2-polyprenyl-6-methoxyphenol hydroxylase-like FAD-dependent oxidoreductase